MYIYIYIYTRALEDAAHLASDGHMMAGDGVLKLDHLAVADAPAGVARECVVVHLSLAGALRD